MSDAEVLPDRAPDIDPAQAGRLAADLFGIVVREVKDLGSHQDKNFRITTPEGRFVLKVANTSQPDTALDAQNAAMVSVAESMDARRRATGAQVFASPLPVTSLSGRQLEHVDLRSGRHSVRLLSFVEGIPMTESAYLSPLSAHAVGALAGSLTAALAAFDHPGAHRVIQWDVRRAAEVVQAMSSAVDEQFRDRVRALSDRAARELAPLADELPAQIIHGDLTDFNIVARRGEDHRLVPSGVIDFGDLVHSWRVGDAAVTVASQLVKDLSAPLTVAGDVLAGYVSAQPLTDAEVAALWPLMVHRACAGLASTAFQLGTEPDNDYLHANLAVDIAVFEAVEAIPFAVGHAALAEAAGVPTPDFSAAAAELGASATPLVLFADPATLPEIDLGVMADIHSHGTWADPAALRDKLLALGPGVLASGQAHPHRAAAHSLVEPHTIHLGNTVLCAQGDAVAAPVAGTVRHAGDALRIITGGTLDVVVRGIDARINDGVDVTAGTLVGAVRASDDPALPAHVHVSLVSAGQPEIPPVYTSPSSAQAWFAVSPDPAEVLGRAPGKRPESSESLRQRRLSALAEVQKFYYGQPPRIERGWKHHLMDTNGRVYLDGVNNVAVLGHSHPAVEEAVGYALRTLNTNSRFHFSAGVDFAEQLKATLPTSLSRVFLLASGSEAVDLALRLARVHTGAKDTICLQTAYHGWTTASDEVSSALMDNPNALATRPQWIHLATPPNMYRGEFTGEDAGTRYADDVRRLIGKVEGEGRRVATFICETLNGNAGGIELPPGYLEQAYRDVRAAGGVVIADEVQVGYGRLGHYFWGFEMHGVVPDIVCLAKATGNGYPVSAVVCTEEIAASFEQEGSFFASMGGSPAGAAAATATLRTILDEDLMGNAARMGTRLEAGLRRLVDTYEMAGAVHGMGLYLGLEFVTDKQSKNPATEATMAFCDRLLRLGVIMQPTGDYMNVLKIKPPLCIDEAGVDFMLEAMETAFREGW